MGSSSSSRGVLSSSQQPQVPLHAVVVMAAANACLQSLLDNMTS